MLIRLKSKYFNAVAMLKDQIRQYTRICNRGYNDICRKIKMLRWVKLLEDGIINAFMRGSVS